MLEVKDVSKNPILRKMNFRVKRGEIAIFLGSSGAGKTTFLRALNYLETLDEGICLLDGVPLDLSVACKKARIGMVFQHFNLFEHLSVVENITLALIKQKGKTKEEALLIAGELLKRYELSDKALLSVNTLSGGQKQRLAIARTVALEPEIICLDEPTSALDPFLTQKIAEYIQEFAKDNKIVLVTTHDMGLVKALEAKLFFMQGGEIIESAQKKEVEKSLSQYPFLANFLKSLA